MRLLEFTQNFFEWLGRISGIALVIYIVVEIMLYRQRKAAQLQAQIDDKALYLIDKHIIELTQKRRLGIKTGDYGIVDSQQWSTELTRFYDIIIKPEILKTSPQFIQHGIPNAVAEAIKESIEFKVQQYQRSVTSRFSITMSPIEYESFVADQLKAKGWSTQTTKGSGDQGVDVIADRNGIRAVIQCKLYSSAVGNAAVQQVIGGKAFYNAQIAIVISNSTYTPAAKQLAAVTGVKLLHHDDISSHLS